MSAAHGSAARAFVPAAGAAALFLGFWLGLGVPLAYSLAAGAAAYVALFFMLKGAAGPAKEEARVGDFVDRDLARKTAARGRELAREVETELAGFEGEPALAAKFRSLAGLLTAIAADVEADPKDALSASVFLGLQGEAVPRLLRLCRDLRRRGASETQLGEAGAKIDLVLEKLIKAHEDRLARLQDDNLAELQVELDVLGETMGIDEEIEASLREAGAAKPAPGARRPAGGGTSGGTTSGGRT